MHFNPFTQRISVNIFCSANIFADDFLVCLVCYSAVLALPINLYKYMDRYSSNLPLTHVNQTPIFIHCGPQTQINYSSQFQCWKGKNVTIFDLLRDNTETHIHYTVA